MNAKSVPVHELELESELRHSRSIFQGLLDHFTSQNMEGTARIIQNRIDRINELVGK